MSARAMSVASQLAEVLERVSQAAVRCQRPPSTVSHRTISAMEGARRPMYGSQPQPDPLSPACTLMLPALAHSGEAGGC